MLASSHGEVMLLLPLLLLTKTTAEQPSRVQLLLINIQYTGCCDTAEYSNG